MRQCENCALEMPEVTEEELASMLEEYSENFPGFPFNPKDSALICEECYQEFMKRKRQYDTMA